MSSTTSFSLSIPQPAIDSFYAAIQRRRLFAWIAEEPEHAEQPRYEILSELGSGGMGVVYRAYHHHLQRTVAIKRVRDRGDPELQQRLVDEARAMARLSHPNVITVFDIEQLEGTTLIVMEYVEGHTLRHWLTHERPSCDQIIAAFLEAGEGLIAAHAKQLIHGDFKPSNVMIDREGRVRVMDFGLSRQIDPLHDQQLEIHEPQRGTPSYMAPEQLAGAPADERSDQYAYCRSLYRALWGPESQVGAQRPRLARIIRRGLHRDPQQRHPSMRALVDALRAELQAQPRASARPIPRECVSVGKRRSPAPMDGRAWMLVLLCVLATWMLSMLTETSLWAPVILPGLGLFASRSPS